jgi:hypothetical protein
MRRQLLKAKRKKKKLAARTRAAEQRTQPNPETTAPVVLKGLAEGLLGAPPSPHRGLPAGLADVLPVKP